MNCTEKECKGWIDMDRRVILKVGCSCCSVAPAYPCIVCGKLHWSDGTPATNRQGNKAFFEKGVIVHKDENNQPV